MSTLKDAIRKTRSPKAISPDDIGAFITQAVEGAVREEMNKLIDELPDQIDQALGEALDNRLKEQLRGDKGDRGPAGPAGTSPDVGAIVRMVMSQLKVPKDGKDGKDGISPSRDKIVSELYRIVKLPKDGKDGQNGSPDSPQQIASKLNTLDSAVDMNVIKGLRKYLSQFAQSGKQKKGGEHGGMGNVQHQHTAISSATTTVSTTSRIAGAGFALWVFYNGQMIARGTDYTVGTDHKTLTLLFTPQNSTVLDIIYIRT